MSDDPVERVGKQLVAFLPNLRRFALSLCRSSVQADDLVQLACERALSSARSFEAGTRFDAWIFRILRNLWIDQLRRLRTAGPQDDLADHEERLSAPGDGLAETRLMLGSVAEAIDRLPMEQREVLVLVCVEDFSYKEAAETLDIPIGTVMSRLARARMAIASDLGINEDPTRSSPTTRTR